MINELSLKEKRVLFAKLAGIAYRDVKDARQAAKLLGFTKTVLIDIEGAQTYVFTSKTDCAIACRGTEPSEMNDIYADLEIFKADSVSGNKIHQGFKEEVDKIYDEVFLVQTMLFGRNVTYRLLDAFVFEQIGPEGLRMQLGTMAVSHQKFQNGFIPNYTYCFSVSCAS